MLVPKPGKDIGKNENLRPDAVYVLSRFVILQLWEVTFQLAKHIGPIGLSSKMRKRYISFFTFKRAWGEKERAWIRYKPVALNPGFVLESPGEIFYFN